MKRALFIVGSAVLLVIIVAAVAIAFTFMGRQSIKDGADLNGIRIVADGYSSLAVLPTRGNQVALIDAGNSTEGKAILAELSRRKIGPEEVAAIFLTHGHPDHRGAVKLFPKAQVMALEAEVPVVEGRENGGGPMQRVMPASPSGIKVTRVLHDGEVVSIGDKQVNVFSVPGHTPGSAAYFVDGVLFMGDSADAATDGKILGSAWLVSNSQADDEASLVRLAGRLAEEKLDVKAIAFAHSGFLEKGLTPLTEYAQTHQK